MPGSPQSDDQALSERRRQTAFDDDATSPHEGHKLPANLEERELEAALQLLVERAQYITGATGTALALPQGDEMVCRASAGACAPTVGARLQVQSGLTGESIARRQLLRCDNAETDPRVNLETCRALGIASIVVLPLLRRTGEVRGLFELFSDHPYAFEERDLVALERMAALTLTALDLAEQRQDSVAPLPSSRQTKLATPAMSSSAGTTYSTRETPTPQASRPDAHADVRVAPSPTVPVSVPFPSDSGRASENSSGRTMEIATTAESTLSASLPVMPPPVISAPAASAPVVPASAVVAPEIERLEVSLPEPAPVPEAMRRIQKCASCGFPVSEGRTLCLDCESLERVKVESEKKAREKAARDVRQIVPTKATAGAEPTAPETETEEAKSDEISSAETEEGRSEESLSVVTQAEILPPFLTNPQLVEEPWLARHVNLLALLVLIAMVLVAAVVFFR